MGSDGAQGDKDPQTINIGQISLVRDLSEVKLSGLLCKCFQKSSLLFRRDFRFPFLSERSPDPMNDRRF